jgi:hypothetical protein
MKTEVEEDEEVMLNLKEWSGNGSDLKFGYREKICVVRIFSRKSPFLFFEGVNNYFLLCLLFGWRFFKSSFLDLKLLYPTHKQIRVLLFRYIYIYMMK